ncbi:MAG: hypothetical protein AVO33_08285 [delta proteobacterium ML8_F1]|nr:MAG: hypothetical protein AVO33_08285 [delta proteobacterium ML8_F1]
MKKILLIRGDALSPYYQALEGELSTSFPLVRGTREGYYRQARVLIVLNLNNIGKDFEVLEMLSHLKERNSEAFRGSFCALVVFSKGALFTKEAAREVVFLINEMGGIFFGAPLVEALGDLENLKKWSHKLEITLEETLKARVVALLERLVKVELQWIAHPRLLVLHADRDLDRSNTHLYFKEVSRSFEFEYKVIHVEDGTVMDCRGCSFKTCSYYAENNSCFYGGVMVKEILPAIEEADAILWLLPNYNDAISAKLMAVINRLGVLFKKHPLMDKNIFAIAVSGNSGSDSVLKQLIGALNINKGYRLPPRFSLHSIANDAGEIAQRKDFAGSARAFGEHMNREVHWK